MRWELEPWSLRTTRAGLRLLGGVSPGLAGRVVSDLFLRSRRGWTRPPDTLPLGARAISIRSSGAARRAYAFGRQGPTVLLVHGWGADSSSLYGLAARLAKGGLRCITYDGPAHGVSPGHRTTMTEFVATLRDVLDGVGDLHAVVAHSLGGLAAVAAITQRGGRRPRRLALLGAPANLSDLADGFARRLGVGPDVCASLRRDLLRRNGVPIEHWDIASLGVHLDVPTLVVHDHDDDTVPFGHAERISATLPNGRLTPTAGLGHVRILGDRAVHATLRAFLHDGPIE